LRKVQSYAFSSDPVWVTQLAAGEKRGATVRILIMFGLLLSLAACSGDGVGSASGLNPFNWYNGGTPETLTPKGGYVTAANDYRPLADQLTDLSVERTASGLVITATALMPTQGWYFAELLRVNEDNATEAIYEFHVLDPYGTTRVSTPRSREITAGAFLSTDEAAGIRTIRVIAARNSLTKNR
jgi:hypothetical protein